MDWKLQMDAGTIPIRENPLGKHPDVDKETNTGNDSDTDVDIETKY